MLEKAIEQITAADLQELVDEKHREGKLVDFKADFWRVDKTTNPNQVDRDKQVVEFLKDVSSFANTDGGHLIVGITDEDGSAFDVCGVQPRSQDEWKSRLDQLMQKWLDPRINSVMRFIELAGGKQALVIHILPSTIAPHRVTYQEQGHFYARNSHGAYTMDTEELRASFNRSLAIADRIRNFHLQRIHLIETTGVPCQLRDEPRIVMHLIPQSSFTERVEFTIDEFKQLERQMGPPGERNWTGRPNLDGYVNISGSEDPHPKRGFLQLFRNGGQTILGQIG